MPKHQPSYQPEESTPRTPGILWPALLLLTALAVAIRFWRISAQSFWLDEAASWSFARYPIGELLTRNVDPGNPPLYYLALGAWMRLFGDSEAALRGLSALAGALSVPMVYLLGNELFGRRAAVLAALLLSFSPIHLFYSQEARQYAPAVLFGLLSAWLFVRALKTDRWAHWMGAALFAAVAFYIHYSALLVPAFEASYVLIAARRWHALAAAAAFGILCLPGAVLFLAPTFLARDGYQYWQGYVTPADLARMANKLFGKPVGATDPVALKAACALLLPIAVAYPLWVGIRAAFRETGGQHRPILFALLYVLVPIALFAAVSRVKPVWQERYLLVALPGYVLVLAWALLHLRGAGRALLATSLALLYVGGIAASVRHWRKEDWREAVGVVQAAARSVGTPDAEVLVTMPFLRTPFNYYSRGSLPLTGYPQSKRPLTPGDAAEVEMLAQQAARRGTVFVIHGVAGDGDPGFSLERRLAKAKGKGVFRRFVGMRIFAFGKGAPALGGIPVTSGSLAAEDGRYR